MRRTWRDQNFNKGYELRVAIDVPLNRKPMVLLPDVNDVKCNVLLYRGPDVLPINMFDTSGPLDQEPEYESLVSVSSTINQTVSDMKLEMIEAECKGAQIIKQQHLYKLYICSEQICSLSVSHSVFDLVKENNFAKMGLFYRIVA